MGVILGNTADRWVNWENYHIAGEQMCIADLFLSNFIKIVNFLWIMQLKKWSPQKTLSAGMSQENTFLDQKQFMYLLTVAYQINYIISQELLKKRGL
jgi:hypothetical protein